jgi:hypothetical protein
MIRLTIVLIAFCSVVGLGSASATPQTPSTAATALEFSGSGDRKLPRFKVLVPSTLRWTTSGPAFQMFPMGVLGGWINSQGPSGATYLQAGTHQLEINAYAAWTVKIVPGIEHTRPLGGGLVGFRGNGDRDLPPFTTARGTTLVWTNSGAVFRIASGAFTLAVKSSAKRGTRAMPAGLHEFKVTAMGSWTIGWKP